MKTLWLGGLCLFCLCAEAQAYSVQDDSQQRIEAAMPAKRIVTLAPFLTELLYSIDAADTIVATVDYSNFPEQAKTIRRIGNYENIDVEQIIALKPDIVLAWESANNPQQLQRLAQFGLLIYRSEPRELTDIAATVERLGAITGKVPTAKHLAESFTGELTLLRQRYEKRDRIRAFYQVWHEPIYTVNGAHIISKVMQLCGIDNVFAGLTILAPVVPLEAVLKQDPDMIIVSGMADAEPQWLADWRHWPNLTAVKHNNLFFIHPDLIQRHSLRMLDAAKQMCEQGDVARRNLEIKKRGQTH